MLNIQEFLNRKLDGHNWTDAELDHFVQAVCQPEGVSNEQIGAFLMLVKVKGLSFKETASLTTAKVKHSIRFDWTGKPWAHLTVDKHSTGGIGDKTSHIIAPILAALGLKIPMISGRGLGVTGGTLDKLEAIRGYSDQLSVQQVDRLMETAGFCITGQTKELVPADRRFYAIRDTTATVASIPLISASILSKKLCEDIKSLVLDMKLGEGMFASTVEFANELASTMLEIAKNLQLRMTCMQTDMRTPLGCCIGNALEMAEVFLFLNGSGQIEPRLEEVVYRLATEMLMQMGKCQDFASGRALCQEVIRNGKARLAMQQMLEGHGVAPALAASLCQKYENFAGAKDPIDHYLGLMDRRATFQRAVTCPRAGFIGQIRALGVGKSSWMLGAGRNKPGDPIDYTVGVQLVKHLGDAVRQDEAWAIVHFSDPGKFETILPMLEQSLVIVDQLAEDQAQPLIVQVLRNY